MTTSRDAALGELLVTEGSLRREEYNSALEHQLTVGGRLDSVLLELGLSRESVLLEALSSVYNTPPVSGAVLAAMDTEVARLISPRMAARFRVVPFRREGKRLSVAMLEPGEGGGLRC